MRHRYRGWVPTVTGRLSFSHFGNNELHDTRDANRSDRAKRYLLVFQRRDTSDIFLPFRRHLGQLLFKLSGDLIFVCLAETKDRKDDRQAFLTGTLFMVTRERWRADVREPMRKARNFLRAYRYDGDGQSIETYFAQTLQTAAQICSRNCCFQASFCLHRNGTVDITLQNPMELAPDAPPLPDTQGRADHVRHILAAQLFFFLKDIGHRHKHHDNKTDTIVDLYDLDVDNEISWRLSTLYSMYRRIISNKRGYNVGSQFKSLGLLAYAKAFKYVCLEELPRPVLSRLPTFYDDTLEESIRASELSMGHRAEASRQISETVRNVLISGFGILLSLIGILSLAKTDMTDAIPSEWLVSAAKILIESPFYALAVTFSIWFFLRTAYLGRIKARRASSCARRPISSSAFQKVGRCGHIWSSRSNSGHCALSHFLLATSRNAKIHMEISCW